MINRNLKQYSLYRAFSTVDEYGQVTKNNPRAMAIIQVSVIFNDNKEIKSNPLFSKINYIGICSGNYDIQKLDKLDNDYLVKEVIKAGRKTILYLEEI